jgi:hypothetical protein
MQPMTTEQSALERGRVAYAARSWLEAYESFAAAEEAELLAPEDLELRATTARMLVRDDEAIEILERAAGIRNRRCAGRRVTSGPQTPARGPRRPAGSHGSESQ